jgi:hypothetical protein
MYAYSAVLFNHKEEWNYVLFRKRDVTRDHHVKQNKTDSETEILYVFFHYADLKKWHEYIPKEGTLALPQKKVKINYWKLYRTSENCCAQSKKINDS